MTFAQPTKRGRPTGARSRTTLALRHRWLGQATINQLKMKKSKNELDIDDETVPPVRQHRIA
jgi:hypothetical protein